MAVLPGLNRFLYQWTAVNSEQPAVGKIDQLMQLHLRYRPILLDASLNEVVGDGPRTVVVRYLFTLDCFLNDTIVY